MDGSRRRSHALLVLLVALVVALAGWWWSARTEEAPADQDLAAVGSEPDTPEPLLPAPGAAELLGDGAARPTAEATPDAPSLQATGRWTLTFECQDADGKPTRWTHASVHRSPGTEPIWLEPADETPNRGSTEIDGRARLVVHGWNKQPWISETLGPPASGTRHLTVRFEDGVSVSGRVFQQDGETPLSAGKVTAWCPEQLDPWRPALSSRWTIVRKDGTFTVPGLYPGTVRLVAEAYDRALGTKSRVEAEGGDEHVRMVLGKISAAGLLIVDAETGFAPSTKRLRIFRVDADGEEPLGQSSWTTPAADRPAIPGFWHYVKPGTELGFRVRAQGYRDSGPVVFRTSRDGGKEIFTIRLEADPTPLTTVRFRIRADEGDAPKRISIARIHGGTTHTTTLPIPDGEHTVEAMPGSHVIEVGGARRPKEGDRSTFWIPQRFEFETEGNEVLEYDVTLEQGGWLVFVGDPDPRPRLISFEMGETTLERPAVWGRIGRNEATAYGAGILPPGTWTLAYEGRKGGSRVRMSTVVEIKRGKISYVEVTELEMKPLEGE